MKPNRRALSQSQRVQCVATAAYVLMDRPISNAPKVMKDLRRIEPHGALGFEQADGVGEIPVLRFGREVTERSDHLEGHRLRELS